MAEAKRSPKVKKHKGAGHRKRLRTRFLEAGLDGFLDYEVVELLLTLGTPRKDCKQMAKRAIKEFRGLRGTLDASSEELQQIKGIGPRNLFGLKLFQAVSEKYAKERLPTKITFTTPKEVVDYLRERFGREKKEHFIALLLDSHNNLVSINDISIGTLDASLVHPREVFEPAVKSLAAQIILAHNHPSGDPEPSEDDLKITKGLVEAGRILGIEVIDHIIVTKTGFLSFREKFDLIFNIVKISKNQSNKRISSR